MINPHHSIDILDWCDTNYSLIASSFESEQHLAALYKPLDSILSISYVHWKNAHYRTNSYYDPYSCSQYKVDATNQAGELHVL